MLTLRHQRCDGFRPSGRRIGLSIEIRQRGLEIHLEHFAERQVLRDIPPCPAQLEILRNPFAFQGHRQQRQRREPFGLRRRGVTPDQCTKRQIECGHAGFFAGRARILHDVAQPAHKVCRRQLHAQLVIALIVFARRIGFGGANTLWLHLHATRAARLAGGCFCWRGFWRGG